MSQPITSEVLTLEEAANYLKLPLETIEREASRGHIPGRRIEDTWRFLKSAIDDWLRAKYNRFGSERKRMMNKGIYTTSKLAILEVVLGALAVIVILFVMR